MAPLVASIASFKEVIGELASGEGPLAVDAERASGYKYFSHAYLFQFYRRGSRIFLIDPIPLRDEREVIDEFNRQLGDLEWIIHASTQDLPCIREFGFTPRKLFDTELGARLAGLPKVGLGPLTEELLSLSLAKEHSAVDWSIRPLHPEWKNYAALDVDVLPDLYDSIIELLRIESKLDLAREEFQSILDAKEAPPRKDPWRRTSGIHHVKGRRGLAIVRELWKQRDDLARSEDLSPGRLLPDFAISDIAMAARNLTSAEFEKAASDIFKESPHMQRHFRKFKKEFYPHWVKAVLRALKLPEDELPQMRASSDALPPVKVWREKAFLAYARLTHARFNLTEVASQRHIPLENLISPESVRRIAWQSERFTFTRPSLHERMLELGVRPWQIELTIEPLMAALQEHEPRVEIPEEEQSSTSPD